VRLEHEHAIAGERIGMLLQELTHRVKNSLQIIGVGGRLIEGFAQQLGGQLKRESGNKGTTVCLTLPSREASHDPRA
jgi:two-component sensor histidine kinase